MSFKDSKLAHDLLDGLTGIEIGGAAHNQFHLNTINVDRGGDRSTWVEHQNNLAGSVMPVDVVANGDDLPFSDKIPAIAVFPAPGSPRSKNNDLSYMFFLELISYKNLRFSIIAKGFNF